MKISEIKKMPGIKGSDSGSQLNDLLSACRELSKEWNWYDNVQTGNETTAEFIQHMDNNNECVKKVVANIRRITITNRLNINFNKIEKLVSDGYITKRKHPDKKLYIYNYTNKTQFDGLWNEETMICRGLITDEFYNIISKPFKKFFNIEQLQYKTPDCNYDVYTKIDGSLGISYPINGSYAIATRGSFDSPQAIKATEMLNKYNFMFEEGKTYLFEIIYPDNKVVVDYKGKEELILIGIINNKTGKDEPLKNIGFEIVNKGENETVKKLMKVQRNNEEGFVLKFDNGERIKIKMEEYKRLHKLLTGVSNKNIWENLKEGSICKLLENVPDEFNEWCKKIISEIETEYEKIETICKNEFRVLGDRKKTALYYKTCKYPGILFLMLDERDYSELIWKLIKPSNSKVYRQGDYEANNSVR